LKPFGHLGFSAVTFFVVFPLTQEIVFLIETAATATGFAS
jgi:hypothetical protein